MRPEVLNPLFAETESLEGVGPKLKKPLEKVGLTPQHIARDVVAQVLGSKIPVARPLPAEENARISGDDA